MFPQFTLQISCYDDDGTTNTSVNCSTIAIGEVKLDSCTVKKEYYNFVLLLSVIELLIWN